MLGLRPFAKCSLHLAEARETYFEHWRFAAGVGLLLIGAGLACLIHAAVPSLCEKTASRTVSRLTVLFAQRDVLPETIDESSGVLVLVGLLALSTPAWILLLATPGHPMTAASAALLTAAVPLAYLLTNPQLDSVP